MQFIETQQLGTAAKPVAGRGGDRRFPRVMPAVCAGLALAVSSAEPVRAQGADADADGPLPRWNRRLVDRPEDWFASDEGQRVAANVLRYQSAEGAWPKNTNLAATPLRPEDIPSSTSGVANTIDNEATTVPIRFLARFAQINEDTASREAVQRGLDYLLKAQYPNGGWPQYFPLRRGYHSHITYNDDAMVNVLDLLLDVSLGEEPFDFVDEDRRQRAATAVERGIECILRTQIRQEDQPTGWCAQYDPETLAPAWGRAYEPPSISGAETVGVARFLMRLESPSPEAVEAIEGAIAWLDTVGIEELRLEWFTNSEGKRDRRVVEDASVGTLWARFYELETNRPLFVDRDGVLRYDFAELTAERRQGYSYYGTWPAPLLATEYPRWRRMNESALLESSFISH
nr:pectate lyase [uncultured bacterium]